MTRVITIDGPSGSGKGTIAQLVAEKLGWRILDSGAIYRVLGLMVDRAGISVDKVDKIEQLAANMPLAFESGKVFLAGEDVSSAIRSETAGNAASKVAAIPAVRAALLSWQRNYAMDPGLVADGRDMGTVVFPAAEVKIYLTASAAERAQRRYKQLNEKGLSVNLADLTAEILERDERDRNRSVAPLKPAENAVEVDSTSMTIDEVANLVLDKVAEAFPDLDAHIHGPG